MTRRMTHLLCESQDNLAGRLSPGRYKLSREPGIHGLPRLIGHVASEVRARRRRRVLAVVARFASFPRLRRVYKIFQIPRSGVLVDMHIGVRGDAVECDGIIDVHLHDYRTRQGNNGGCRTADGALGLANGVASLIKRRQPISQDPSVSPWQEHVIQKNGGGCAWKRESGRCGGVRLLQAAGDDHLLPRHRSDARAAWWHHSCALSGTAWPWSPMAGAARSLGLSKANEVGEAAGGLSRSQSHSSISNRRRHRARCLPLRLRQHAGCGTSMGGHRPCPTRSRRRRSKKWVRGATCSEGSG